MSSGKERQNRIGSRVKRDLLAIYSLSGATLASLIRESSIRQAMQRAKLPRQLGIVALARAKLTYYYLEISFPQRGIFVLRRPSLVSKSLLLEA
jgi:hypothetical protein